MYMVLRHGAKVAILCALIMFFMPFVMVSCSEMDAEETYSGVELMVCSSEGDSLISAGEIDEDDLSPNIWLILACVLGIAALIVSFVKKAGFIPAALAAVSAILLIIFRASFVSYYNLEEFERYLEIKTQWGYILCLILMIIGAVLSCIPQKKN